MGKVYIYKDNVHVRKKKKKELSFLKNKEVFSSYAGLETSSN